MNREEKMHSALCRWIRLQHRNIIFNSDMSGVNLHGAIRGKIAALRSTRAMPDLTIYKAKKHKGEIYFGLLIELKAENVKLLLKDGERLRANPHINEQAEVLTMLSSEGYLATFAVGIEEAMAVINWYLIDNNNPFPGRQYLKSKGICYG